MVAKCIEEITVSEQHVRGEVGEMPYGKPLAGVCMATALFVCSALGVPTLPSSPPAPDAVLIMSASGSGAGTVTAGVPVTITGDGFAPNANIVVGIYSTPSQLDAFTATSTGSFTRSVTIPSDLTGSHTLVAEGNGPGGAARVLSTPVSVLAAGSSASALAFTGFNTALFALLGIALLVAGLAVVRTAAVARRRARRREVAQHAV